MPEKSFLPEHVAIIMDGNRRWAKAKGLPSFQGHKKGVERVKEIIEAGGDLGIKAMTFYCFSTENWQRSKIEVNYLMRLFNRYIKKYFQELKEKEVRFRHLGRKDRLPAYLLRTLNEAETLTKKNRGLLINFALDYGGRDEILRAIKKIQQQKPVINNETDFREFLDTGANSDVDLLIRTSGEQRVSNFLLWQLAYAEFAFVPEYFPDFTVALFKKIVENYKARKRRFGK